MAEEVFKYVQIGGEEYRIEKFAPVPGLQLARLTLAKLTPVAEKLTGGGEEVLAALCAAVSSLTDEEVEALTTKCLRFCCKKKKLGWAVEAKSFAEGVVRTRVDGRGWTGWARLPFVDYEEDAPFLYGALRLTRAEAAELRDALSRYLEGAAQ